MPILDKETAIEVQRRYSYGTAVILTTHMLNDPQALPIGSKGIVHGVDDNATIFVEWENGSQLGCVYGEDELCIISNLLDATHKEVIGWAIHALFEASEFLNDDAINCILTIRDSQNVYNDFDELYEAFPIETLKQSIALLQISSKKEYRNAGLSLGKLYSWFELSHEHRYL